MRLSEVLCTESVSRYCSIYKAKNGKWYLELANREYGDEDDASTYGPFNSEKQLESYLRGNFSNPGGSDTDRSGKRPVPKRSPNGDKVEKP